MVNFAENSRNLPKPLLAHYYVLELPSEQVTVDTNTLPSQINHLSLRATYPAWRFYKNGWLEKHNRHVALLKVKSNISTFFIGDSITTGLMRYSNVWYENFNIDIINREIDDDKMKNVLWRTKNICLPQLLKYAVTKYGVNNLGTDNPYEMSN